MWVPTAVQAEIAIKAYKVLRENLIVYISGEERVGKTLSAILVAEMCQNVERVAVLTTAKALDGWLETLANYNASVTIDVTTHGKPHELHGEYQLVILDEAHKNFSAVPKKSKTWGKVREVTYKLPIIYLSATPHPQGYQQLYHQFALSDWSPWKKYKDFYRWFDVYGVPSTTWMHNREVASYTSTKEKKIKAETDHLFVTKTRKEAGFKHEPKDKIHYIELGDLTKEAYNYLMKHKMLQFKNDEVLVCDHPSKYRASLAMIEGGTMKLKDKYFNLSNREKIDYILETWGDTDQLCIFYNYKQEEHKLKEVFKHAHILQASAYAEGVDLSMYETLVVYSQNFSTGQYSQRRARQANMARDTPITVHFLLVKNAVSEQCYECVAHNKQNFVDTRFERIEI